MSNYTQGSNSYFERRFFHKGLTNKGTALVWESNFFWKIITENFLVNLRTNFTQSKSKIADKKYEGFSHQ